MIFPENRYTLFRIMLWSYHVPVGPEQDSFHSFLF